MAASASQSSEVLPRWHCEDKPCSNPSAVAQKAFQEGLAIFKESLTKDPGKRQRIDQLQASSLQDVLNAALAAKTHYQAKRAGSRIRECITAFAARVCHYGNIMDVLVQHHPEYVSLVWGAMKLLFGVCESLVDTVPLSLTTFLGCRRA